jgi:hypothetical protein
MDMERPYGKMEECTKVIMSMAKSKVKEPTRTQTIRNTLENGCQEFNTVMAKYIILMVISKKEDGSMGNKIILQSLIDS